MEFLYMHEGCSRQPSDMRGGLLFFSREVKKNGSFEPNCVESALWTSMTLALRREFRGCDLSIVIRSGRVGLLQLDLIREQMNDSDMKAYAELERFCPNLFAVTRSGRLALRVWKPSIALQAVAVRRMPVLVHDWDV